MDYKQSLLHTKQNNLRSAIVSSHKWCAAEEPTNHLPGDLPESMVAYMQYYNVSIWIFLNIEYKYCNVHIQVIIIMICTYCVFYCKFRELIELYYLFNLLFSDF